MLSLNEIETVVAKACLGVGIDPGSSAEVGRAVRWLCVNGLDPWSEVADAIVGRSKGLSATPSLVDAALVADAATERTKEALLLIGMAGIAAASLGCAFVVEGEHWSALVDPVGLASLDGIADAGSCTIRRVDVRGREPVSAESTVERPEEWESIERMAARTYVPSSEHSRIAGAGAGLTDND